MENEFISQSGKKKRKKKDKWRLNWRELAVDKFVDLVMVILGVYIAFQLNNWQVESADKNLERFYLESMVTDLKSDQRQIKDVLAELESDRRMINNYLEKQKNNNGVADSLGVVLVEVISLETFTPAQNTYQMLLASNGLTSLTDRNIRSQTAEYYNQYISIKRFEEVYTELLLEVLRYFNPSSDLAERKILDSKILSRPETRNFLLMSQGQLNDGIETYSELSEKGTALIQTIEQYLQQ